jgi:phage-related protein
MIEEFTWKASEGTRVQRKPRVIKAQYGDGYTQRSPDGINNLKWEYELTFKGIGFDELQEIDEFLARQGGYLAFEFTPPPPYDKDQITGADELITVVCEEWSWRYEKGIIVGIDAKFMEEPA